jgi:hypothetical protein
MTKQEIVRELRQLRYGRTTLTDVCRAANISRPTLYVAINQGALSDASAASLEIALQFVRKGAVPQTPLSDAPKPAERPSRRHPMRINVDRQPR